jgi:tripartite-type tricarboxylate transporter receptor subunit TctC
MKQWFAVAALAAVAVGAQAQTFPGSKPVSIVVPFAAGGPTDRVARDLAEAMRKYVPGSNFVV